MHKHTHEDSKNKGGGGSILVLLTTICPTRPYAEILWGRGGGGFFIIMWNTANKFLELKLRDLVHIWGIFHLNDYETKIHCFQNFGGGGGGTCPCPPPPPPAYGHAAQKILYPTFYLPCTTYHHPSCRPPWTQH